MYSVYLYAALTYDTIVKTNRTAVRIVEKSITPKEHSRSFVATQVSRTAKEYEDPEQRTGL